MLEKQIEAKLREGIRKVGGLAVKLVSPGFAGIPDRLILMPGGRLAFVEMKAPGKVPTKLQQARIEKLRKMGFYVFVLDTPASVADFVEDISR